MKQETFDKLRKQASKSNETSTIRGFWFIEKIKKAGIPVSAIFTNDWSSSPNTIVYVAIPYGSKKNGGKSKEWKNRFGDTSVKSALSFWKSRN